jgi:hypothetical protein
MDQLGVEVDVGPVQAVELGPALAAVEGDRVGERVVGGERGDQLRGLGGVGDAQPARLIAGRQLDVAATSRRVG